MTADPCSVDILVVNVWKSCDVDANLVDSSKAPSSWPVVTFISFKVALKSVVLVPLVIPASEDKGISVLFAFSNVDDSYFAVLSFSVASELVVLLVLSHKVFMSVPFEASVAISVSKFLIKLVLVMIPPSVTNEVASQSKLVAFSVVKLKSKSVASIEMSVFSAKSNPEVKLLGSADAISDSVFHSKLSKVEERSETGSEDVEAGGLSEPKWPPSVEAGSSEMEVSSSLVELRVCSDTSSVAFREVSVKAWFRSVVDGLSKAEERSDR